MAKGNKRGNSFLFYTLILLNIAASALAIYGLSGQWKIHEESKSSYEDLQQSVAEQSEALLAGELDFTGEEDTELQQAIEEEDADQDAVMWIIEQNQQQYSAIANAALTQGSQIPEAGASEKSETPEPAAPAGTGSRESQTARDTAGAAAADQEALNAVSSAEAPTAAEAIAAAEMTGVATESPEETQAAGSAEEPQAAPSAQEAATAPTAGDAIAVSPTGEAGDVQTAGEAPAASWVEETSPPLIAESPLAADPIMEALMERAVQVDEAHYSLDFTYLKKVYPQLTGWLIQEGTKVNYPVMQAKDNEFYLDHLYNGRYNKDGAIFLDCGNSGEYSDANNYIYGHNTKTGEMFGALPKYKDQVYYDANPRMTLMTPYSDYQIDIFAATMSLVEDETSWRLKQFTRKAEFDEYIAGIKAQSFFTSEVTPEWGDQLLVLCTCTNEAHGERYVVYGRMRPISYGTDQTIALMKQEMDGRPTQSGKRTVGSLGQLQLYAQNDELWAKFRYEPRNSEKTRRMGDGGTGAAAVAMAVANLVSMEELPRLFGYARSNTGFTFCTHSVNQYYCNKVHAQYQIKTPEEFLRYLPVAMASFATGNNIWDVKARTADRSGTNMLFLPYIAGIYGLKLETSKVLENAVTTLKNGGMVVCLTSGSRSPFVSGSQYVVLAGMDDEYLYILDPNLRDSYSNTDRNHVLEVVAPNAVRVRLENIDSIGLGSFYMMSREQS